MDTLSKSTHWTEESTKDFTHRIASDFLAQLETKIEKGEISRTELARRLKRTLGRVSQLFNPGNITIDTAVRLVRAMDMKVALIAYDDHDPRNHNGPVNSEIFYVCWKHMGAPTTFFELSHIVAPLPPLGHMFEAATTDIENDATPVQLDRSVTTRGVTYRGTANA